MKIINLETGDHSKTFIIQDENINVSEEYLKFFKEELLSTHGILFDLPYVGNDEDKSLPEQRIILQTISRKSVLWFVINKLGGKEVLCETIYFNI